MGMGRRVGGQRLLATTVATLMLAALTCDIARIHLQAGYLTAAQFQQIIE